MTKQSRPYKAETSKYPIKAGNVLLPKKLFNFFNTKIGTRYDHRAYIWILLESTKRKKGRKPKRRAVKVIFYFEPVGESFKHKYIMTKVREVQFESICKHLRKGYKLIAKNLNYHYRLEGVAKFYKTIGVL